MLRNEDATIVGKGLPRSKIVRFKEIAIEVYTIGWLALLSQMAKVTLRGWEKDEVLPKPLFTLNGNFRYYTPKELELYVNLINLHFRGARDLRILRTRLHEARIASESYYKELATSSQGKLFKLKAAHAIREAFVSARKQAVQLSGAETIT